ncbi:MAG: hypothetical protein NTY41_05860 [Proteobacteria bacterium]|nr:hypothetical protein [Pseudomonadota bacterium]
MSMHQLLTILVNHNSLSRKQLKKSPHKGRALNPDPKEEEEELEETAETLHPMLRGNK